VQSLQKDLKKVLEVLPEGVVLFKTDNKDVLLTNKETQRMFQVDTETQKDMLIQEKLLPMSQPESKLQSVGTLVEGSSEEHS